MHTRIRNRWVVLAVFGVLFIALFAIVGVANGIGQPSVPSDAVAVVDDVPDGTVTNADFQTSLKQIAFSQGITKVPSPSDPQYATLRDSAMADALLSLWVRGEAAERGITVSDSEVETQLQQIIQKQLGGQKGYQRFLKTSGYSDADAHQRVADSMLGSEIQKAVLPKSPSVPQSLVDDFYEANKTQFTQPETRDVREIVNKDSSQVERAKQLLDQDDSPENWKKVAAKYSTDQATKSTGGLRQGVTQGQSPDPALDKEVFTAPQGQLVGPFKGQAGYYLIEVDKITPEKVTPLSDATSQIKQQLSQGIQQDVVTGFQQDFVDKWTSRTFCAPGYVMNRCANYTPPDACSGDDPGEQGDIDKTGCPAYVPSLAPVAPGAGGLFPGQPAQGLPQGPQSGVAPATPGVIGPSGAPQLPPGSAPPGSVPPGTAAPPSTGTPPSTGAPPSAQPPGG